MQPTSSQVVDALQSESALGRLLDALGCDPGGSVTDGRNIRCPMPGHPDEHPSCTVRAKMGMFHCQTLCGQVLPLDLIVAHGKADDRAGAARFLEELFRIAPRPADAPPVRRQEPVDDPSLTVAQMLGMLGLPSSIADTFHLEDVQTWHDGSVKHAEYETGFYTSVLIPYSLDLAEHGPLEGRPRCLETRARVRSCAPSAKLRWANKAHRYRFMGGKPIIVDRRDLSMIDGNTPIESGGYGLPWLSPAGVTEGHDLRHIMLVVEGESDVWAAHAMGFSAVMGVPGSKYGKKASRQIAEAALIVGEGSSADVTIVVWEEPDVAGMAFPEHVAEHAAACLEEMGMPAPRFAALRGLDVEGSPKDLRSMWQMHGAGAQAILAAELSRCSARATGATDASPDPAPEAAPTVVRSDLLPPAPAKAKVSRGEKWLDIATLEGCPDLARVAPLLVQGGGSSTFIRTETGWSEETTNAEGKVTVKRVCDPFVVTGIEVAGEEKCVRLAAPFNGKWIDAREKLTSFASADRGSAALMGLLGVTIAHRQKSSMLDLVSKLAKLREADGDVKVIPKGTGWTGAAGASLFSGVEVECADELPQMMFEANEERRSRQPDEHAAAAEWWEKVVRPLTDAPTTSGGADLLSPSPRHAAPLIAFGASAAGPLVAPLNALGVNVSPVAWLSGLGGGGKTVTLRACASIYAPEGSQGAFVASADMSRAALNARGDYFRDLPLMLDDVTQMQPLPGTTARGEAARVEAAAKLAMSIFNRKPTERATRDGGIRLVRPYRSTALFTAESSLSQASCTTVSAGQIRRVNHVEAKPMTDRGLKRSYSKVMADQSRKNGGAAGSLLVKEIRRVQEAGEMRDMLASCRGMVAGLASGHDKEQTQKESLALCALGFCLLARACGALSFEDALELCSDTLGPYLEADSRDGGAISSKELAGHEFALDAVRSLVAANGIRFLPVGSNLDTDGLQLSEIMGRAVEHGGRKWTAVLQPAMHTLAGSRYGVTAAMIQAACEAGVCKKSVVVRFSKETRVRCTIWLLDLDDPDEPTTPQPPDPPDPPSTDPVPPPRATASVAAFKLRLPHGAIVDEIPVAQSQSEEQGMAKFMWSTGQYQRSDTQTALQDEDQVRAEAHVELVELREAFEADGIVVLDPPDLADEEKWAKIEALGREAPARLWSKCAAVGVKIQNPDLGAEALLELKREHVRIYRILLMLRMRCPHWFLVEAPGG